MAGWLARWLAGWLPGWLAAAWLAGCLAGWLSDRLAGLPAGPQQQPQLLPSALLSRVTTGAIHASTTLECCMYGNNISKQRRVNRKACSPKQPRLGIKKIMHPRDGILQNNAPVTLELQKIMKAMFYGEKNNEPSKKLEKIENPTAGVLNNFGDPPDELLKKPA